MWLTWKIHKDLTSKPHLSQNWRFQEETGGWELSPQNRRKLASQNRERLVMKLVKNDVKVFQY